MPEKTAPRKDDPAPDPAPVPDPAVVFDPANPQPWDDAHPDENWISYTDIDGFHRVPVWYYRTLGL